MIDWEIEAFIADAARFEPEGASKPAEIREQRRRYDAFAAAFALPRPAGVTVDDKALALPSRLVPLRLYRPEPSRMPGTILYAHGGGFILGSLDSHDGIVARLADTTGARVVAIDYRLAPEHPAPAAADDALAVALAALGGALPWPDLDGEPIALAGDSAGAMLLASAALRLAGAGRHEVAGLALAYPMLAREPSPPACRTEAQAPMLSRDEVIAYRDAYLAGRAVEPWTFPADAPSLAGMPPTFLLAAEHDPLRDDATVFAERLAAAGIAAELVIGPGLVHGFLRAIDRSRVAGAAFEALCGFLAKRLLAAA